jgi:hypothetical protein
MSDYRHRSERQTSPWGAARNASIHTRVSFLLLTRVNISDQQSQERAFQSRLLGAKPFPVPLRRPQIRNGLTWGRTRWKVGE